MIKKHAKKELEISSKFEKILSVIPNYKDFFIFPEKICNPADLIDEDKINFT